MAGSSFLSKSRHMAGLQCQKRLWLSVYKKELATPYSPGQLLRLEEGNEIGRRAQAKYPGGVLAGDTFGDALKTTPGLVAKEESPIFEATFAPDDMGAMIDILRPRDDGFWDLIEVKSSTKVKPEHLPDIAFQTLAAVRSGLGVGGVFLMYVNNRCRHPDLDELLVEVEMTDMAFALADETADMVAVARKTLRSDTEPIVPIGSHCFKPYKCPFVEYCHEGLPSNSVFTIPRLAAARIDELIAQNVFDCCDVPDSMPLSDAQDEYVSLIRRGEPRFDRDAIQAELGFLDYPLYCLDFEAVTPAVPRFEGMRPYEKLPFQFSCHVMGKDGSLEHHEYLHEETSDPRGRLAARLLEVLGTSGTIVMYTPYERQIMSGLADALPDLREPLVALMDRLWDLADLVKHYVHHPDFCGSYSIKKVLPVLVPELSYDALAVSDGTDAGAVWERMIRGESEEAGSTAGADREALLAYCKLDTEAMVRVLENLSTL